MRVAFGGYYITGDFALGMRVNPPAMLIGKSADRLQQVVSGQGWSEGKIIDRGNQLTTLSFRAERVFDTTQEAESYMIGYEAAGLHPWDNATALLVCDTPGGIKYHYMFPAAISAPRFSYMGCRVFAEYTITGGQFTTVADYSASYWFRPNGNRVPTGEKSTLTGEAWERSGNNLRPKASLVSDDDWEFSGSNLRPKA